MMRTTLSVCLLLSLVVCLAGCSDTETTNRPQTFPVSGTVTHQGKPVEGATVNFHAKAEGAHGAAGRTDAEGRYALMTFEPGDGALPGDYTVTVARYTLPAAPAEGGFVPADDEEDDTEGASSDESGRVAAPPKQLLPAKYATPEQSDLKATVAADSENQFNFELR